MPLVYNALPSPPAAPVWRWTPYTRRDAAVGRTGTMRTFVTYFLDRIPQTTARRGVRRFARRAPEMPTAPDNVVNAFNTLEQQLDGLRDAGRKLALVSESLRTSAREMKASVDKLDTPSGGLHVVSATPRNDNVRELPQRGHLRLLKTVA
jgi:hypothetical protein